MIVSKSMAEKVRIKRGKMALTKTALCIELGIARQTLTKIEKATITPQNVFMKVS